MVKDKIDLLLTKCDGCTGEHWPDVVAVCLIRTKMTKGQYSPVQTRVSEVSKLFIIQCIALFL